MQRYLKNYTSEVPVYRTIAEIEKLLVESGVSHINKEYGEKGRIKALYFQIELSGQFFPVRMPVKAEECRKALWSEYIQQTSSRRQKSEGDFTEQADRTAWRLMKDWVEVQMSMVNLGQADFRQVFMGYLWNGRETFYDHQYRIGNVQKMALPEKT